MCEPSAGREKRDGKPLQDHLWAGHPDCKGLGLGLGVQV